MSRSIEVASISAISTPPGLPEIPGGWGEQRYVLADHEIVLTLPANPDAFLDDADVLAANRRDDYMPYWSYLWPASFETAIAIIESDWAPDCEVLEIGAGVALTGMAAMARGCRVTISDYDPLALQLANHNAIRNGWGDRVQTLQLDWRKPESRQYPVVIGCEVIYERRNHPLVLDVLSAMLHPTGVAWISDPGRHQASAFLADAHQRQFEIDHRVLPRFPYSGRPDGHTNLYLLRHRTGQ